MQGAGNEFLACTRFTGDQYRDARLSKPANGSKYFLHRRGLAQHIGRLGENLFDRRFALALAFAE